MDPKENGADGASPPEVNTGKSTPPPQPDRRGPGRPRKNANGATPPGAPPETPVPPAGDAPRRGRPPKRAAEIDVDSLAQQIKGLHAMAAVMTGLGILAIDDREAVMLAGGLAAMSREYNLALDGKTGAAIQLLAACAMVYGPRVLRLSAARAEAAKQQQTDSGAPALQ